MKKWEKQQDKNSGSWFWVNFDHGLPQSINCTEEGWIDFDDIRPCPVAHNMVQVWLTYHNSYMCGRVDVLRKSLNKDETRWEFVNSSNIWTATLWQPMASDPQ